MDVDTKDAHCSPAADKDIRDAFVDTTQSAAVEPSKSNPPVTNDATIIQQPTPVLDRPRESDGDIEPPTIKKGKIPPTDRSTLLYQSMG